METVSGAASGTVPGPTFSRFAAGRNQRYRANGSHDRYLITVIERIVTRIAATYPLNGLPGARRPTGTKPQQQALPDQQAEQGVGGHDGSAEFRGYAARFRRSCRGSGGGAGSAAETARGEVPERSPDRRQNLGRRIGW